MSLHDRYGLRISRFGVKYDSAWVPETKAAGFSGSGFLGQFLHVLPQQRIVAVRMRRRGHGGLTDQKGRFSGMLPLLMAAVAEGDATRTASLQRLYRAGRGIQSKMAPDHGNRIFAPQPPHGL